ncbi:MULTISPECIES: acyltransferase family protein [Pseudomonas]|uniref:acyltransferase family protein n=1 Tax=Pseudomonas TaxID=286 RepID=UPI00235F1FBC|nr:MULTISPECIES: acyltransferase [Pseudomonas]WJV21375.1 acyltransferase [Pseudomonas chlororaphis]
MSRLPACFADLKSDNSRSSAMDGVRAIAALLVAAGHYGLISQNANKIPVWIFFCLSGYLLSEQGLKLDFSKLTVAASFFKRRIFRLYPLYLFAIILCSIFGSPNVNEKGWHYFLTRSTFYYAEGFFWTIKQEFIFYAIMPLIILILLPLKTRPITCATVLIALAVATCSDIFSETFTVAADQSNLKTLYFAPFLTGMAGAYLQSTIFEAKAANTAAKYIMSITLYVAVAFLGYINFTIPQGEFFHSELAINSIIQSMPAMLAILVLLRALPQHPISRFFSTLPLRAIGIVGYSFYMWHWPVNIILEKIYVFHGWPKLLITGSITYIVSCFTYCLIEKPFMNFSKKTSTNATSKSQASEIAS